ncbi:MAG: hypothetical protein AAFN11_15160, partial [Chloroflexota bacterium]
ALRAYYPLQQRLFTTDDNILLFWLDRTAEDFDLRVQVGGFNRGGIAELGPVVLSDQPTRNYSVVPTDDNLFRVVWSGGLGQTTNLYLNQVDAFGRPFGGGRLRIGGDYPALLRAIDGTVHLFWLEDNGRDAYSATFNESNDPVLTDIQRVVTANISGTDIIEHFSLAYDGETVTLIWHVRRVNNTRLVITSSASLANASDASAYTAPEPLRLPDDTVVQWLTPTNSPESNLPVAVHDGRTLSFAQMTDGQLTHIEQLVETGSLIGAPAIASSPRTLALSWAQPSGAGYANLFAIQHER